MKAVIIAGGRGERLKPLTDFVPKPMVKVKGKTILEHTIDLLKKYGIREYIFSLCYLPEVITSYFGDGKKFRVDIKYTYEDPKYPLGTAGAINLAKKCINDTFIITYADILRVLDVQGMIDQHNKNKALTTINVYRRYGANPKSMVTFNKDGRITNFVERPDPSLIKSDFVWANGAFFVAEPEIFSFINEGAPCDFGKDVFPTLIKEDKKLMAFPSDGYFIDIGDQEKLKKAEETFLGI